MKRTLWLVMMLVAAALLVSACDRDTGTLDVTGAWVRAIQAGEGTSMGTAAPGSEESSMSGGVITGAFLTISNSTSKDERLLAAFTPGARVVEIHESFMENDVMKMRPVERLEIPAGESVSLEPGGLHLMLIGVYEDLQAGDTLPLTLTFEQAGSMTVQAEIRAP